MSCESETSKENRLRHQLRQLDHFLRKTPSRHWTQPYYGAGYMVCDHQNIVVLGCAHREYDATLEDVEDFLADLVAEEASAAAAD